MRGAQFSMSEGSSRRQLWTYRFSVLSQLLRDGNVHLACVLLALFSSMAIFLLHRRRASSWVNSRAIILVKSRNSLLPAYAIAQTTASAVAFSLSLCLSIQSGIWQESVALGYLFLLGLSQFVAKSDAIRACIRHQVNGLAFVISLLEAVEFLLPLCIVGTPISFSSIEQARLAFLALTVLIAFFTPRHVRSKESNLEDVSHHGNETPSAEETCSWFSYYFSYDWLTYLILRGARRDLQLDDLPALPSYDAPLRLLERITDVRLGGSKTFRSICKTFRWEIVSIMSWAVLTATVEYVAAFAMFRLLGFLEDPDSPAVVVHPAVWIALLFLGPMTRSVCYQRSIFKSTRLMVLWRATVLQEIYQKMLGSRSEDAVHMTEEDYETQAPGVPRDDRLDSSTSKPVKTESLVSYDADMISNASDMFYAFTASFVSTAVAMTFLYQLLGWPSVVGIAVMVIMTPLPAVSSQRLSRLHRHVMEATDRRLGRISEYLHSIRTIKYFAWEPMVIENIDKIRLTEQQRIWKRNLTSMLVSMTGDMLSLVSLLAMFASLIIFTDRPLRAPMAFTSLAITETLRSQFVWLCKVIQWVSQARGSLKRVDSFLDAAVDRHRHEPGPPQFKEATVRWYAQSSFALRNLSLSFQEGRLNVINGPTGSGKTLLLLSLLGETTLESGQISCPADVAYVPQTAWLQNTSIRNNILFYSAYDQDRYNAVLQACALHDDLSRLPLGDSTQVGERGSVLSGGQKQRISLARALYSPASTLLLDDIFSALDTHTTSQVYGRCFHTDLLAGRTVILVTHLASALRDANFLVSLDKRDMLGVSISSEIRKESAKPKLLQLEIAETESSRTPSLQSVESSNEPDVPNDDQIVFDTPDGPSDEKQASGRVPRHMIFKYMLLFGGLPHALLAIISALVVQLAYFSITLWLSIWTSATAGKDRQSSNQNHYLYIYTLTVLGFVLLQFSNNFIYQRGGWHASKVMHQRLVNAVVKAPISWFDHTPTGQILNRFGLDTQSMDAVLIDWLRMTLDNALRFVLRLAGIASIMPVFALPAGFFCLIGFATGELYSRAEISIKRIVAIKFAPVFSHFNETSAGIAVIRARRSLDGVFQELLADKLAQHMRAAEAQFNCNRWVSIRSDFCAATIAATAGFIAYHKSGSAGLVGFSLTNAIGLSQTILTLVRNMNELEVELNSFQRIHEYTKIEPEESAETEALLAGNSVPASWPASGKVEIRDVKARYTVDQADVLHGVSFDAKPGERIAIIGRTGSGKSTLGLSILRSTYISSGQILVDGLDITKIPLRRLRRAVSLIPQDTMLFSGDAQSNLDPLGELDDAELRSVLRTCDLAQQQDDKLSIHMPIASGGKNFSNGQRQVFGLARAMCRRSKLVIMDEATASVDHETDARMQRLIRSEFVGSTIITIAHRLRTVVDYDRVIVMREGRVVEMGTPAELIEAQGTFWDMLRNTGEYDELMKLVKEKKSV